jgi:hypothetical protein
MSFFVKTARQGWDDAKKCPQEKRKKFLLKTCGRGIPMIYLYKSKDFELRLFKNITQKGNGSYEKG